VGARGRGGEEVRRSTRTVIDVFVILTILGLMFYAMLHSGCGSECGCPWNMVCRRIGDGRYDCVAPPMSHAAADGGS
jgi:hypothetical protein